MIRSVQVVDRCNNYHQVMPKIKTNNPFKQRSANRFSLELSRLTLERFIETVMALCALLQSARSPTVMYHDAYGAHLQHFSDKPIERTY